MLPYIFIGQIKVSMYYTAMILGYIFTIVIMLLKYRRKMYNLHPVKSIAFATIGTLVGILGAKSLYIIECFDLVKRTGLTFGGFSFFGAVFMIPVLMPLFGIIMRIEMSTTLDSSALCTIAMLGLIRVGCFLNGCCGGIMCTVGQKSFRFPTQTFEAVFDFWILGYLLSLEKKGKARGLLYPLLMVMYGTIRFFIEFLRDTSKDWLNLSHGQWFSIAAIIIGAIWSGTAKKIQKNEKTA